MSTRKQITAYPIADNINNEDFLFGSQPFGEDEARIDVVKRFPANKLATREWVDEKITDNDIADRAFVESEARKTTEKIRGEIQASDNATRDWVTSQILENDNADSELIDTRITSAVENLRSEVQAPNGEVKTWVADQIQASIGDILGGEF